MAEVKVMAEGLVGAPAHLVYQLIADYRAHHHRFLPNAFSDFHVEQGDIRIGELIAIRINIVPIQVENRFRPAVKLDELETHMRHFAGGAEEKEVVLRVIHV